MKPTTRTLFALTLLAAGSGAVSAQQTLTFTNTDTSPGAAVVPLSVSLLAGSSVSIAPSGNINAQCVLAAGGTVCAGLSSGGGGALPEVSLVAGGFSQPPTGGLYPAGTNFTITPTVSNAEVCVRAVSINGEAATTTGWPGTATLPFFNAQTVSLPAASSTYLFSARCFGPGGATTTTLAPIQTSDVPPPGGCAAFTSPLPQGWSRSAVQNFSQVESVEVFGGTWNEFPNSGSTGYLITGNSQYISLRFTTPANVADWTPPFQLFEWQAAQQQGAVALDRMYATISSCPGDFRIPPIGQVAPADDTTFARGCRSIRPNFGLPSVPQDRIPYQTSMTNQSSDDTVCRMAPGRTYYFNFIRANALDGSIGTPAEEASCANGVATSCGVQARVH